MLVPDTLSSKAVAYYLYVQTSFSKDGGDYEVYVRRRDRQGSRGGQSQEGAAASRGRADSASSARLSDCGGGTTSSTTHEQVSISLLGKRFNGRR